MLKIIIPATESWNAKDEIFVYTKETSLNLEHSLISLSKWESKWKIPFLSTKNFSIEQTLDYVRFMTLNKDVPPFIYKNLGRTNMQLINNYIEDEMTATTFNNFQDIKNREVITSEIIYYWMIALNVPMECEKWHLNRLLTLINVCNIKTQKPKKMSKNEIAKRNHYLNEARKQSLNTRG